MSEGLNERCRRICQNSASSCFIHNKDHITCLSDMLINNVCSITSVLELIKNEPVSENSDEYLEEALNISRELVNWVKYLQIAHDITQLKPPFHDDRQSECRGEWRYPLPETYHDYISVDIHLPESIEQAKLVNFSRSGLQVKSPVEFNIRQPFQCTLRTNHVIDKRVTFTALARYILLNGDDYIIGASVTEVSNGPDLDFFRNVYEFISLVNTRSKHEAHA